jgi:hypothetical protein
MSTFVSTFLGEIGPINLSFQEAVEAYGQTPHHPFLLTNGYFSGIMERYGIVEVSELSESSIPLFYPPFRLHRMG